MKNKVELCLLKSGSLNVIDFSPTSINVLVMDLFNRRMVKTKSKSFYLIFLSEYINHRKFARLVRMNSKNQNELKVFRDKGLNGTINLETRLIKRKLGV